MARNMMKKIALTITLTLSMALVLLGAGSLKVDAGTVFNPEKTAPSSGNVFVSIAGTFYTDTDKKIVDRINAIRYEACKEGVKNPATGKKLTMADYKPVTWSSQLEAHARIRAAEASVNWNHTRPNYTSTFNNNIKISGGYHSGENLAMGYGVMQSIEGYYSEKAAYVGNKGGMTGHYTNMINPNNNLVGVAGFAQNKGAIYSAMEFGKTTNTTNDKKKNTFSGAATQIVEVNVSYMINSVTLSGNNSIPVNGKAKLTATANLKNATKQAPVVKGASWKSSNTKVATVDANGYVTGKAAGTATISVNVGGKTASYKVTITNIKATSIKLNTTSKSIVKGSSFTLTSTVAPSNASNKKVTYKSSNTKVATVDANGKVTAVAAGTATITATTADGSKKSATCKVTVTNPVKVTSLKLNATSKSIVKGYTFDLKATIAPTNATNKNVSYTSSNTKVATVDANGKIKAVAAGTATITVTTKDGTNKKATCKVTVTNPVKVTSVKLNVTSSKLTVGKTLQLKATIAPANATVKNVTFKSSNTKVATVDANGKVIAKGAGTAVITVTSKDGSKIAKCTVTVSK